MQDDHVEPGQVPFQEVGEILFQEGGVAHLAGLGGGQSPLDVVPVQVHPYEPGPGVGGGVDDQAQP